MSALALPALGLANRAIQASPALFGDLAERSPSAETVRLDSTGYAQPGVGAASYISDVMCNDALLAAHPNFVFRTANGRIFRLMPEAQSFSVEQGGAVGDGTHNDQPAIQAAIDYAEAAGAAEVRFESAQYRIDCPVRTSPMSVTRAEDGHPLVVRTSLRLRGCAATRSVFDFRALDGADPETDYQLVATSPQDATLSVWRGGGLLVQGDASDPGDAPRSIACLELDRLVFQGNRAHTGAYQWPADPNTGDGWDISDKGFWSQDCFVGEIVCRDVDMVGWKGEIFFLSGASNAVGRLELQRCRFNTSNGVALNPGTLCEVLAVDCDFGDCMQAQEDIGKIRAVYRNCTWHDCDTMELGSGTTDGVFHTIGYPTRDTTQAPPLTLLEDCEFRDIRSMRFGSWVKGRIRLVDASLYLNGAENFALRDTELEVDAWIDRKNAQHALEFYGLPSLTEPVPNAPDGVYKLPPSNIRIRLRHHRTAFAQEQGHHWIGCFWNGYIDPSCELHIEGKCAGGGVIDGGPNTVSMPLVTQAHYDPTLSYWPHGWQQLPAISGSGEIMPSAPFSVLRMESGIIADMTLARVPSGGFDYGYVQGQRVRFVKDGDTGSIRFTKGASDSFGVAQTRVLELAYDWIEFSYNRDRQRWEEEGFFSAA